MLSLVLILSMWGPESIRRKMWSGMDHEGRGSGTVGMEVGRVYGVVVVAAVSMHLLVALHETHSSTKQKGGHCVEQDESINSWRALEEQSTLKRIERSIAEAREKATAAESKGMRSHD